LSSEEQRARRAEEALQAQWLMIILRIYGTMDAGNIPWKPMVILEQSMVGASKNIQKIWNLDNLIIALDRRYFSYVDVSRISLNRFSPHPGCFLERRFCFFFVGKAETNHKCF